MFEGNGVAKLIKLICKKARIRFLYMFLYIFILGDQRTRYKMEGY